MKKTQLLAPARGVEELKTAVQSGATEVYLGLDRFSARRSASNFTPDELPKWVDYCHLRNTKVHLAANTLIKENEIPDFLEYIKLAYKAGIDAVIIQDIGMADIIKKTIPELSLHASTQMSVTTAEGATELQKRGFERVVLARELTKDEIEKIRKETFVELEVFIHGALCFSYSGQCLFSSVIGQRSGNRGCCAQPCRLCYDILKDGKKKKSGYLLSPKDLSLKDEIKHLTDIGIDSFKIEGRLKKSEYVATTVNIYNKCLNGEKISRDDEKSLLGAFNRSGFTKGWYAGGKDMMSLDTGSNVSDGVVDDKFLIYTKDNMNSRKRKVDIFANLSKNSPLSITMIDESGISVTREGKIAAEPAINKPLDEERIKSQLQKLGNTVFEAETCEVFADDGISLPIQEINNLRRQVCQELEEEILKKDTKDVSFPLYKKYERKKKDSLYIVCVCRDEKQVLSAEKCNVKRIIAPLKVLQKVGTLKTETVALLDEIGVSKNTQYDSLMVSNLAQISYHKDKKLYASHRLNVTNSYSIKALGDVKTLTLSPELNLKDIKMIPSDKELEVVAYGRLPLMLMRNCPAKACGVCKGEGGYSLKDRKNEIFPIQCGENCTSKLLNSKPILMYDKMEDLLNSGIDGIQLWFYDESQEEVEEIITKYKNGERNESLDSNSFTRGHFYRGMV